MAELTLSTDVDAPAAVLWATVTDWELQGRWVLGTHVSVTRGSGAEVGDEIAAVTGVGPLAFTDTMRITRWQPPFACHVDHVGAVVRGRGVFRVHDLGAGRSRFTWYEDLDVPLGRLGALAWPLVLPAAALGVRLSLRRLAALAQERA